MDDIVEVRKALAAAEQFIVNGVELGYIRMPAPETPDSAQVMGGLRALMSSFEPKHEHKEAVVAWCLREWCDGTPTTQP